MDDCERRWARAMQAGRRSDTASYERFLREVTTMLRPSVRAKLQRYGLGSAEAEDVVQEVLIAIHTKRHTWDSSRPFLPWLRAIAHHKLVDAVRRLLKEKRRHRDVPDDDWEQLFEAPVSDPDRGAEDLDRHLVSLPARQRDILGALTRDGMSVKDVAARLQTSEGVVRMTFHRALEGVRRAVRAKPADVMRRKT